MGRLQRQHTKVSTKAACFYQFVNSRSGDVMNSSSAIVILLYDVQYDTALNSTRTRNAYVLT
jgi:hypothetical protein